MADVIDFEDEKRRRALDDGGIFAIFPKSPEDIDEDVLCRLSDPCDDSSVGIGVFSAGRVDGVPADGWSLTPEDARLLARRLLAWADWCERGFEGDRPAMERA